jgi:hypothetical protein
VLDADLEASTARHGDVLDTAPSQYQSLESVIDTDDREETDYGFEIWTRGKPKRLKYQMTRSRAAHSISRLKLICII